MLEARPNRRPVPADLFGGRLTECFLLDLEVTGISEPRPQTRTISFTSPDLVDFAWQPGQDVMFEIPGTANARRRYTIRRADPVAGSLDIDVVLHGTGPFARWAANAVVGDRISGIGPRGVVTVRENAAHHLFVADDSAVPFTLAMIEALPSGREATALLAPDEPLTPDAPESAATLQVSRVGAGELVDQLRSMPLPEGTVAYINGERTLVRHAVNQLTDRGLPADAIASKAYWRRDQANAAHGEPARD